MGYQNRKRRKKTGQKTGRRRTETIFESFRRLNDIFIPTNNYPLPDLSGALEKFNYVKLTVISYRFYKMWEEANFHKDSAKEKRLFESFWEYNSLLKLRECPGFERVNVLDSNVFDFESESLFLFLLKNIELRVCISFLVVVEFL